MSRMEPREEPRYSQQSRRNDTFTDDEEDNEPIQEWSQSAMRPDTARRIQMMEEDEDIAKMLTLEEDEKIARKIQAELDAGMEVNDFHRPASARRMQRPTTSKGRQQQMAAAESPVPSYQDDESSAAEPQIITKNRAPSPRMIERRSATVSKGLSGFEITDTIAEHGAPAPPRSSIVANTKMKDELNDLFGMVSSFQPETIDLTTKLQCFIPEYIAAIADLDPMIKIPPPGSKSDDLALGVKVLDEPNTVQSDPAVVDIEIRALAKGLSGGQTKAIVRTINDFSPASQQSTGYRALNNWLQGIKDVKSKSTKEFVDVNGLMPDVEALMQEWPEDFDQAMNEIAAPSAEIDLPLSVYSQLLCNLTDIPVHLNRNTSGKHGNSNATIKSLYNLFLLYHHFQTSQHFGRPV